MVQSVQQSLDQDVFLLCFNTVIRESGIVLREELVNLEMLWTSCWGDQGQSNVRK